MFDASLPELRRACERARALGRPVLAVAREPLVELPDLVELFSSAERHGEPRFYAARPEESLELLGLGRAWELRSVAPDPIAEVRRESAALLRDAQLAESGGPLFVGGVAFEARPDEMRAPGWRPFANARFAIPELALERRTDSVALTLAALVPPGADADALVESALRRWARLLEKPRETARVEHATRSSARPPGPSGAYRADAARVIAAIRRGEAQKAVLALREGVPLVHEFRAASPLRALLATHPGCLTFAHGLGDQTFLGASPERLVSLRGGRVEAWAVAGTARRDASASVERALARELLASPKERAEHAFVVGAIETALRELCSHVELPDAPELLGTGTVQHLYTPVRARSDGSRHVLELVARLHPTPALGGTPREAALDLIRGYESFDRGWYAGPLGWFDPAGGGEFWVALRCGLARGRGVELFAGSGLVAQSDPDREAAETALKLRSLWEALELE